PAQTVERHDLRVHCLAHLPEYMVPSTWLYLDELPLTVNGKLDRKALPASDAALHGPCATSAPPATLLEEMLCDIWKDVLGVSRIGVDDDFFALGGHSLKAIQVVHRMRAALHVDVPVRALFNAPTISATAAIIESLIDERLTAARA